MGGVILKIDDRELQEMVKGILDRTGRLHEGLDTVGELAVASVLRNFEEGGRPAKWKPLADSTIKQRQKLKKWPGNILVRSGDLKAIAHQVEGNRVVVYPGDVTYAAIHQFGGMAGRGRKVEIPARPYLMLQKEDEIEIVAVLADFIMEGKA